MKKITLAFYKKTAKDANWKDKLVAWYTRGLYSHVEIILNTGLGKIMWSASPSEGKVRAIPHIYDESTWSYLTFQISDDQYNTMLDFLRMVDGNRYDYLGILGFILPLQDRSNKWFCSELVANCFKIIGDPRFYTKDPSNISPNKLYNILTYNTPINKG